MLSLAARHEFTTLLDASTLTAADERPAIIYVSSNASPLTISRHEFRHAVLTTARSLVDLGIRPGEVVVIAHTQSLESIYAFWGALAMRAIPSMFPTLTEKLDPDVYMKSMAELVRLSGVAAVLTSDSFAAELSARLTCPVYPTTTLTDREGHEPDAAILYHHPQPDDIAFLQHSSGTTGLQKGVALSHVAALNQLAAYSEAIELEETDIVVSWLPLYHDMGLIAGFLLPLVQGIPLVLMSPFDWVSHPALLFRAINDHSGTLCWLPNFAYNHCARRVRQRDTEGLTAATMRLFINCSEPVRPDSHQLFLERFASLGVRPEMLGVSYAMAENTFAVTQTPPGRVSRLDVIDGAALEHNGYAQPVGEDHPTAQLRVSCGAPVPGTDVRVIDDRGAPVEERVVGEIAIRSDCLLTAYYNRPDLHPFDSDGWFLTGDMGYLADGELFVAGRRKDLIINAGKNIYPADIEAVVNEVPGIHPGRAVAFGVFDEREGTELIAVVAEATVEDDMVRREIGRAIRQEVARRMMITLSYVHLVESKWLLKTSSGKIARAANRDKWLREVNDLRH